MTILLNLFTRSVVREVTIKYHIILKRIFGLLFSSMSCYNMLELCLISTSGVQIRSMHTYRHEGGFLFVLKSVIFSTRSDYSAKKLQTIMHAIYREKAVPIMAHPLTLHSRF